MNKAENLKQAHKAARKAKLELGGDYVVYLAFFMRKENQSNEDQVTKVFSIRIPYSDKKTRSFVKCYFKGRYTWNNKTKLWELESNMEEMRMRGLAEDIVSSEDLSIISYSEQVLAGTYSE